MQFEVVADRHSRRRGSGRNCEAVHDRGADDLLEQDRQRRSARACPRLHGDRDPAALARLHPREHDLARGLALRAALADDADRQLAELLEDARVDAVVEDKVAREGGAVSDHRVVRGLAVSV